MHHDYNKMTAHYTSVWTSPLCPVGKCKNNFKVYWYTQGKFFRALTITFQTPNDTKTSISVSVTCTPRTNASYFINTEWKLSYPSISLELEAMNGPSAESLSIFSKSVLISFSSFLPSFCSRYLSMQAWIL